MLGVNVREPPLGQFLASDWGVMKEIKIRRVTIRQLAVWIFGFGVCHGKN
jgi:hypothetical protein